MSESNPRAQRKQRSPADYPRYNYSLLSSTEAVFIMAQQTRDVALDTRDSMHRIEDLLESYVALAKLRQGIRNTGIGLIVDAATEVKAPDGPQ